MVSGQPFGIWTSRPSRSLPRRPPGDLLSFASCLGGGEDKQQHSTTGLSRGCCWAAFGRGAVWQKTMAASNDHGAPCAHCALPLEPTCPNQLLPPPVANASECSLQLPSHICVSPTIVAPGMHVIARASDLIRPFYCRMETVLSLLYAIPQTLSTCKSQLRSCSHGCVCRFRVGLWTQESVPWCLHSIYAARYGD